MSSSITIRDLSPLTTRIIRHADFKDATLLGEWRFLIALLDRAVKDLSDEDIHARNSAKAWFRYAGPAILGFEEISDYLGVDPEWVRALLKDYLIPGVGYSESVCASVSPH